MNQSLTVNKRIPTLDFLRGLASIGVVFIHIMFPGKTGLIVASISAFAVPIFFMISGYYIYGKDQAIIKERLLWIVNILVVMYVTYLAYNIVVNIKRGNLITWMTAVFTWEVIWQYVLCCTVNFALPMWYLIAMLEIYCIWSFVVKKRWEKKILKWIPILFAIMIAQVIYVDTIDAPFYMKTNVITSALPWFMIGYYLRTEEGRWLLNIKSCLLIIMMIAGAIITTAPVIVGTYVNFSALGWIPLSVSMMILALRNPKKHISKILEYIGERLSGYIYIFHQMMACVVCFIMGHVFDMHKGVPVYDWSYPIITLIAVTAFAIIVDYFQTKIIKRRLF